MDDDFMKRRADARQMSTCRRAASERFEQDAPDDISLASYMAQDIRSRAKTFGGGALKRLIAVYKL